MTATIRPVAVFIATTGGPVQIQQITEEPAVRSVVCIGRTATPLPISDDYDNFVQPALGPVGRSFGAPGAGAYRMDVGDAISGGLSWQAPCFIAHALFHSKSTIGLAKPSDTPWRTLLVTGRVDFDGRLEAVGHISAKIAAAAEWLGQQSATGTEIVIAVPQDNAAELDAAMSKQQIVSAMPHDAAAASIKTLSAPDVDTLLFGTCRYDSEVVADPPAQAAETPSRLLHGTLVALFLTAGIAAAFYASFEDYGATSPEPFAKPVRQEAEAFLPSAPDAASEAPLTLTLKELRPPAAYTCADVQFLRVPAREVDVASVSETDFAVSHTEDLCGVRFVISPHSEPLYLRLSLAIAKGDVIRSEPLPETLTGREAVTEAVSWRVDSPYFLPEELEYSIRLVVDDKPIPLTEQPVGPAWPEMIWNHRVILAHDG